MLRKKISQAAENGGDGNRKTEGTQFSKTIKKKVLSR